MNEGTIDEWNNSLCEMIVRNAYKCIPIKKNPKTKISVPWWNKACDSAVRERNLAYRAVRKYPTENNAIEYKKLRAKARRVIKDTKKECWRRYCGGLGIETSIGEIWRAVHRMTGVVRKRKMPVLEEEGVVATSDVEKAKLCEDKFKAVHSGTNIGEEGIRKRNETLRQHISKLEINEDNSDTVNLYFSLEELRRAINKGRRTAPGKDGISYEIFKRLGEPVLDEILALINNVWKEGTIPTSWKQAVVVPILKPGKNAAQPGSYRPIALTAVLCKIMERMVTDRLVYKLEKEGWFTPKQSGFRRGRNTMDSVLSLEADIKKAMINKEGVVAMFLDIEKAYDMLWKEGLIIKLYEAGIRGRLINWIQDFLKNRVIQVRVGEAFSGGTTIDNGTPQGSVISPVLFNVMINDIFKEIGVGFGLSLFADDGAVWKRGRNMKYTTERMQEALNKIVDWGSRWGFKISIEKTKYVVFGNKKTECQGLFMYGQAIERVKEFKFLGVHFDERLTWKKHIDSIITKCEKVVNVMRSLSGSTWGAGQETQLMIYRAMIRSRLDYGSLCYGTAAKSSLKKLEVVQAKALRVCCGALRTTPIPALLVEMGETPLGIRRTKLAMQYISKLRGHQGENPVKSVLEEAWEWGAARAKKKCFIYEINKEMEELELGEVGVAPIIHWPVVPPWLLPTPEIDLSVLEAIRKHEDTDYSHIVGGRLESNWGNHLQIYTDGAQDPKTGKSGFAFVIPHLEIVKSRRLSEGVSVYTTELMAIIWALQWVEEVKSSQTVICSDSASVLMTLRGGSLGGRSDLVVELLVLLYRIEHAGGSVGFLWVPAHVGVEGNEAADVAAKKALERDIDVRVSIGNSECRSIIKRRITDVWQREWENEKKGRHYFSIQSSVRKEQAYLGSERKHTVVMTRLRLGHCGLAWDLAKMGKHEDGMCATCVKQQTVKHIFMECSRYKQERKMLYATVLNLGAKSISMKSLLNPTKNQARTVKAVLEFIAATGLPLWK